LHAAKLRAPPRPCIGKTTQIGHRDHPSWARGYTGLIRSPSRERTQQHEGTTVFTKPAARNGRLHRPTYGVS